MFILFDLILYVPVNIFSVMSRRAFLVEPVLSFGLMSLAQEHKAVTPARLKPAAHQSRVKHSTTEPLRSLIKWLNSYVQGTM